MKTIGRRTDNQPGAVRTSVWNDARVPVPREAAHRYENGCHPHARLATAAVRAAPGASVDGVNHMGEMEGSG